MYRRKYHTVLLFLSLLFMLLFVKNRIGHVAHTWANDAYKYAVLFAALAEVYFSSRKLLFTGMAAMILFLIGLAFKISHWPGAGLLLISGITGIVSIVFISAISNSRQRTISLIISIWILLFAAGYLFRIQHWPGSDLLIAISMLYLPILAIALGISIWKNNKMK